MSRTIEELLPDKPEARLRIYAWSTKEIKKYEGCLKVGQTTQKDVNVRIRQSQGVAPVKYKLEIEESAEREDGTIFRDSAVAIAKTNLTQLNFSAHGLGHWRWVWSIWHTGLMI